MAQAFGGKVPVTISYTLDLSGFIAALEAVSKECAAAAEALRQFAAQRAEVEAEGAQQPDEPANRYGKSAPELIAMAQQTIAGLRGTDFSAPLADRLRREDCDHAWKVVHQLDGDLQPYCELCWLIILDGYRPCYTTPEGMGVKAEPKGGEQ